jgi:hypothetical protein
MRIRFRANQDSSDQEAGQDKEQVNSIATHRCGAFRRCPISGAIVPNKMRG